MARGFNIINKHSAMKETELERRPRRNGGLWCPRDQSPRSRRKFPLRRLSRLCPHCLFIYTSIYKKSLYGDQKCSCTRTAQLDYCNCGTPLGTDYETGGCCNSGCGRCDISLLGCPSPPPSPPTPPPALYRVILAFHFTYFGRMGSAQLRDHIIDHSRSRFHRPFPRAASCPVF